MGALGHRGKTGTLSTNGHLTPGTQLWVVEFGPEDMPGEANYEVYHGAIRGPGGYFLVYIDTSLYGVGENGSVNEFVPTIPMFLWKGQVVTLNWSIATGAAPKVWLYFRTPEIGRI